MHFGARRYLGLEDQVFEEVKADWDLAEVNRVHQIGSQYNDMAFRIYLEMLGKQAEPAATVMFSSAA
jgi:hypothetical protein